MKTPSKIITTSWDDGHPLDLKIAELLKKYGLQGTFYIPNNNPENLLMTKSQIFEIAKEYELGSHTESHVPVDNLNTKQLRTEIFKSKEWIEELSQKEALCFCYPGGYYSKSAVEMVKTAGFQYARTVELLRTSPACNIFLAPTTIQVRAHTLYAYSKNLLKRNRLVELSKTMFVNKFNCDLLHLFTNKLNQIESYGGIFHLWGHSWEIEQDRNWELLELMFSILSQKTNFLKLSNSGIIRILNEGNE